MSLVTPLQSVYTAHLLIETTKWRNDPSPQVASNIAKRVVSEGGYLLIALIGTVEGLARIFFASIAYVASQLPLENAPHIKDEIFAPLYEGIGLNLGCSMIALIACIYNPFSEEILLDTLRRTYLPCFPEA